MRTEPAWPSVAEIADELDAMVREQATYRENLEPMAARIGLSQDATLRTLFECERRLRLLTGARQHFMLLLGGAPDTPDPFDKSRTKPPPRSASG